MYVISNDRVPPNKCARIWMNVYRRRPKHWSFCVSPRQWRLDDTCVISKTLFYKLIYSPLHWNRIRNTQITHFTLVLLETLKMGWKMLVSYIWRPSREDVSVTPDKNVFYSFLQPHPELPTFYSPSKRSSKVGYRGSPAFRRKGLLKRQG